MKRVARLILSTSPPAQTGGKLPGLLALRCRRRLPCRGLRYLPVVKELDAETGLYYYGARYLDPKTSRWLSGDPAMQDYIPSAPVNDEARKQNQNLPGMGGVFNHVNLHAYHYAGNNPVKYVDPDGRENRPLSNDEWVSVKEAIDFAVTHLDSVINELSDASRSMSGEITGSTSQWLGIDLNTGTNARNFANDLRKIRAALVSLDIDNLSWDNNLPDDQIASSNILTGNIKLDPYFFELPDQGGYHTKFGTMVHEASHIALNTDDITYFRDRSRNLAENSPATARKNASNWEYFINEYVNLKNFKRGP